MRYCLLKWSLLKFPLDKIYDMSVFRQDCYGYGHHISYVTFGKPHFGTGENESLSDYLPCIPILFQYIEAWLIHCLYT